jgi:hypothetical protein
VWRFSLSISSEVPTRLNSNQGKKLRQTKWLISAILREINQLGEVDHAEDWGGLKLSD